MALKIDIYENNRIIKTLKSVKTLEKYMRNHVLQNGKPLTYQKTAENSFIYSYEDINGKNHELLLIFSI